MSKSPDPPKNGVKTKMYIKCQKMSKTYKLYISIWAHALGLLICIFLTNRQKYGKYLSKWKHGQEIIKATKS